MATRMIGQMSISEFDRRCRVIVAAMAAEVARSLPGAHVASKTDYSGRPGADVVTTADLSAQAVFVRKVGELLPTGIGLIGEELGLRCPSTMKEHSVVLTADPGDGTCKIIEAIEARRGLVPGEVSSMLGVQIDGVPVGSYICDVASRVTYVRAPYSNTVLRITQDGVQIDMSTLPRAKNLGAGVLMHHGRRKVPASPLARWLIDSGTYAVQRELGSVGLSVMRVFTGEFTAMLRIAGGYTTPWDDTPIFAACNQGSVVPLLVHEGYFEQFAPGDIGRVTDLRRDVLYIAARYLTELRQVAPVALRR